MDPFKKLDLNTILKLSLIVLAFAGIYYFITAAQLKNNAQVGSQVTKSALSASEEIAWKQKCQQIGEEYFKTLQEKWPPSYDQHYNGFTAVRNQDQLPQFAYNSSLNTCLISFQLTGPGGNITGPQTLTSLNAIYSKSGYETQYYIDDALTRSNIYRWTDDSFLIPAGKNDGTYFDWTVREKALMVNNSK